MSHAASRLTVLSAPLALVDRRALSQAWYSALHLASPPQAAASVTMSAAKSTLREPAQRPTHETPARGAQNVTCGERLPLRERDATRGGQSTSVAAERRREPVRLGRQLARALERHVETHEHASVVLRTPSGRVHVVIRADGPRMRDFALCSPALRAGVERALAHARYALAQRRGSSC